MSGFDYGNTISELQAAYRRGEVRVSEVVETYLARIETLNPELNAVISLNPDALTIAGEQDRVLGDESLPKLFGVPVLIKDNIETKELPTTAGSLALENNFTRRDAPVVRSLREAGAIILGKANLSEWAYFRAKQGSSGWSALGGQTRNPHNTVFSPSGSSSGSAVGVAASLCVAALGTETLGSIVSPAAANGVVGFKPGVSLLSQDGIIPISSHQDTAGPFTRSVRDCALVLSCLSGDVRLMPGLDEFSIESMRLGTMPFAMGFNPEVDELFEAAVSRLVNEGARRIDNLVPDISPKIYRPFLTCALYEFKHSLNQYLAGLPNELNMLNLASLIEFNKDHAEQELRYFGQDLFEAAEACGPLTEPEYVETQAKLHGPTRAAFGRLFEEHSLDVVVAPTMGPSLEIDLENGEGDFGGGMLTGLSAIAGFPHITLPMGRIGGMPVGFSITGPMGSEAKILAIAHRLETLVGYDYSSPL